MDTESGKINGGVVDDGPINNLDGFNTTANFNTTTATTTTTKRTPTLTSTLPGTTGVVTTGANPFARKLEKILKLRLDQDKDLVESMRTLSLFYEHNTVKARRNLRSDIEKKTLEVSAECLDALSLVKDQVACVQAEVRAMTLCCKEMGDRLQAAKQQTRGVVEKTTEMQEKQASTQIRLEVVRAFNARFQLTPQEMNALTGGRFGTTRAQSITDATLEHNEGGAPVPLNDLFFDALQRAKTIHTDCNVLLRTKHQILGLEIMDHMSRLQEAGYERVFRWALAECHGLSRDMPVVGPILRRSLHSLRDRASLYKVCWEEIGSTRRTTIVRQFIDALAIGGAGGYPRPIEMHSHDPMRYVSDMLAWLHQTIAAEQELLLTLLTAPKLRKAGNHHVNRHRTHMPRQSSVPRDDDGNTSGDARSGAASPAPLRRMQSYDNVETDPLKDQKVRDEVTELLTFVMESTCRPFRTRLDQVLGSNPGITVCYRLSNLLQFYGHTIRQTIKAESELVGVIEEGRITAFKVFQDSVGMHSKRLISDRTQPSDTLIPTPAQANTLTVVKEIAHSYSGSLMATNAEAGVDSLLGNDINEVLMSILVALLDAAKHTSSTMTSANRAVYMINIISAVQSSLGLYEFADGTLKTMDEKMSVYVSDMEHAQAMYILSRTDMAGKLAILKQHQQEVGVEKRPLSQVNGMFAAEIKMAMTSFDRFLSMSQQGLSLPQMDLLSSSRLRKTVNINSCGMIVSAYSQLFNAIQDPANQYPDPMSICPRTPAQVKTLLV